VTDAAPRAPLPECRIWLIDGYNLLHASLGGQDRSRWWTAERREALLARVRTFTGPTDLPAHPELWVVFDGNRPLPEDGEPAGGPDRGASEAPAALVKVVFAPSADEWIRRRVRDADEPAQVAVVTGDRPVADRARHRGARVVPPRLFLQHCPALDQP
jgi:predicted RNA-binding protein with PIN domain